MTEVAIRPWREGDQWLLEAANTPAMTAHLVGPETDEQLRTRHENYLRFWDEGSARMFAVLADGDPVGGIGWWMTRWHGEGVAETGWYVLPAAQGRGIAAAAVALIADDARDHGDAGLLIAFPSVTNPASNALCARSGFTRGPVEIFPFRGVDLEVRVWTLDLDARRAAEG